FPGNEVRLKHAYFVVCQEVIKNEAGDVVEIRCTYDPATKSGSGFSERKVKGTIHWVDATHAVPAQINLFEPLLVDDPETKDQPFMERLNNQSLTVLNGFIEPHIKDSVYGDKYQFFRHGYFSVDKEKTAE